MHPEMDRNATLESTLVDFLRLRFGFQEDGCTEQELSTQSNQGYLWSQMFIIASKNENTIIIINQGEKSFLRLAACASDRISMQGDPDNSQDGTSGKFTRNARLAVHLAASIASGVGRGTMHASNSNMSNVSESVRSAV